MEVSLVLLPALSLLSPPGLNTLTGLLSWTKSVYRSAASSSQTMNSTFVPFELRWKVTKYHLSISHPQLFRLYIMPTCALFNDIKVEYSVGDLMILDGGQFWRHPQSIFQTNRRDLDITSSPNLIYIIKSFKLAPPLWVNTFCIGT